MSVTGLHWLPEENFSTGSIRFFDAHVSHRIPAPFITSGLHWLIMCQQSLLSQLINLSMLGKACVFAPIPIQQTHATTSAYFGHVYESHKWCENQIVQACPQSWCNFNRMVLPRTSKKKPFRTSLLSHKLPSSPWCKSISLRCLWVVTPWARQTAIICCDITNVME